MDHLMCNWVVGSARTSIPIRARVVESEQRMARAYPSLALSLAISIATSVARDYRRLFLEAILVDSRYTHQRCLMYLYVYVVCLRRVWGNGDRRTHWGDIWRSERDIGVCSSWKPLLQPNLAGIKLRGEREREGEGNPPKICSTLDAVYPSGLCPCGNNLGEMGIKRGERKRLCFIHFFVTYPRCYPQFDRFSLLIRLFIHIVGRLKAQFFVPWRRLRRNESKLGVWLV